MPGIEQGETVLLKAEEHWLNLEGEAVIGNSYNGSGVPCTGSTVMFKQ
jgi:hypothetical protein